MRSRLIRSLAPAAVTVVVLAGAGLTASALSGANPSGDPDPGAATVDVDRVATGDLESEDAAPDDSARAAGRHLRRRGGLAVLRRSVHGDLIVRTDDGTFEEVSFDRGEVTEVSSHSLSLERPDGVAVTVALSDATEYHGVDGPGEVEVGGRVFVVSADGTARHVAQGVARENRRIGGFGNRFDESASA